MLGTLTPTAHPNHHKPLSKFGNAALLSALLLATPWRARAQAPDPEPPPPVEGETAPAADGETDGAPEPDVETAPETGSDPFPYEDPAADEPVDSSPDTETPPAASPEPGAGYLSDEQAQMEATFGVEQTRDDTDPFEDPKEGYYFAGLFYRQIFVPKFLLNLFTDESTSASNPAFGAEFTYRKDGFDIVGSIWWASWSANGPFRGAGDPESDTEIIDSNLSTLFMTATFLWSAPLSEVFALEYGVGIGVGIMFGDLKRTEAYRDGDGQWQECNGPGDPDSGDFCETTPPVFVRGECDGDGAHYNCEEPKWTGGGSTPNVLPWLAIPHLALRIKPLRQLMMRIEGGFGLGFFLGGSASYGF